MLGNKFNSAKCETTCRLGLGRIKLMKNKKNLQIKQYRKDIAELLRSGKQDYARIRVEAILRENATLQAYEILELYLELIAVRGPLIAATKEVPRDMVEAISSVLYAAQRVPDLPELATLHKMLSAKYGKEYVGEASSDVACARWMVNDTLRRCLTVEPPEPALKLQALSDIAQEFGIEWDIDRARRELLPADDGHYAPVMYMAAPPPVPPPYSAGGMPPPSPLAPPGYSGPPPHAAPPPPAMFAAPPPAADRGAHASFPCGTAASLPGAPPPTVGAVGSPMASAGVATPGPAGGAPPPPAHFASNGAQPPPAGWLLGRSLPPASAAPPAPMAPSDAAPVSEGGATFHERSARDVQAAYDAAAGPPSKAPPAAPAADQPPASSPPEAPAPAPAPLPHAAPLPPPPASTVASAPGDGEFDELQKRFEQLKRGGG